MDVISAALAIWYIVIDDSIVWINNCLDFGLSLWLRVLQSFSAGAFVILGI